MEEASGGSGRQLGGASGGISARTWGHLGGTGALGGICEPTASKPQCFTGFEGATECFA